MSTCGYVLPQRLGLFALHVLLVTSTEVEEHKHVNSADWPESKQIYLEMDKDKDDHLTNRELVSGFVGPEDNNVHSELRKEFNAKLKKHFRNKAQS